MFFLPILLFFFLETPEAFDPRISPHEYGKKTVSQSSGSSPIAPKRTGLLVVDHGSRNAASNSRLSEIASSIAYSFPPDKFTVIAHAHMEIAEPSIPTALTQMFESGKVDRVFVHPFFLSPAGRHASTDIPEIINTWKNDADNDNVILGRVLGANENALFDAIVNTVSKDLEKEDGADQQNGGSSQLSGFFRGIQEMIEAETK